MIDRDEETYTVELLRSWKKQAKCEANKHISGELNYEDYPRLKKHDKKLMKKIVQVVEAPNTEYMLKEHDYHSDFPRKYLDPLFDLAEGLRQPSSLVKNKKLREKTQDFLESIELLRWTVVMKGGPSEYGNGSYIIDWVENQDAANNLCNKIWEKYEALVELYRSLE